MTNFKRGMIYVVIAAYLCACAPVVPRVPVSTVVNEEQRGHLGRVGVVSLASVPQGKFVGPRGSGEGASQGAGDAASGAMKGVGNEYLSPGALILYVILLPVIVPVAAISGAVGGGVQAVPKDKADEIEARLREILAEANPQEELRVSVVDAATRVGIHDVSEITSDVPSLPGEGNDDRQLPTPKVDSILEIGLVSVSFVGRGGPNAIAFHVGVIVRLLNARTNAEIYRQAFTYDAGPRKFSEWNAEGARLIKEETESAYRTLGRSIVEEIFLVVRTN